MAKSRCRWEAPEQFSEWSEWLSAGFDGRHQWRLLPLMIGMLLAGGRRTVTTWLRAAGVSDDYDAYYYFLARAGRKSGEVATRLVTLLLRTVPLPDRLLLVIDDSPTKRYGPHVEGADRHHNPTPGPTDQKHLYGHVWVTISLAVRHPKWGPIGLPLRALLYVRQRTLETIPPERDWHFATKLELAARLIEWVAPLLKRAGKTLWVVVDGGYAKKPFLSRATASGLTLVGRLRKDAALRNVPPEIPPGERRRGRPRIYGKQRISLAKRAAHKQGWRTIECELYGRTATKTYKTFLATWRPADGVIRVVLVKEDHGCFAIFCTDPEASVTEILETFADRATIEQSFHDVKEVWGSGQQQVRNIWTNVGVYNLNLWMHTLVEMRSWEQDHEQLCDRNDSPWDDANRRPSHADRRKALRRLILQQELTLIQSTWRLPQQIIDLAGRLAIMAT